MAEHESDHAKTADDEQGDDHGRVPGKGRATTGDGHEQQHGAGNGEEDAEVVYLGELLPDRASHGLEGEDEVVHDNADDAEYGGNPDASVSEADGVILCEVLLWFEIRLTRRPIATDRQKTDHRQGKVPIRSAVFDNDG